MTKENVEKLVAFLVKAAKERRMLTPEEIAYLNNGGMNEITQHFTLHPPTIVIENNVENKNKQ